MTQEDKQLLLKDLCARLPYGVKCAFYGSHGVIPSNIIKIDVENETVSHKPEGQSLVYFHFVESGNIKPYLRPMSSMTEEERREYDKLIAKCIYDPEAYFFDNYDRLYDWLNSHHFDYRGLIDKSLAIVAPEEMYKYENN